MCVCIAHTHMYIYGETERSSICWLTLQMPTIVSAGPEQNQGQTFLSYMEGRETCACLASAAFPDTFTGSYSRSRGAGS